MIIVGIGRRELTEGCGALRKETAMSVRPESPADRSCHHRRCWYFENPSCDRRSG